MLRLIIILVLAMSISIFSQDMPGENEIGYRPPTVAGAFYPSDPDTLRSMIDKYLNTATPGRYGYYDINGLVAPHAGYVYSGRVAGSVYKEIKDKDFDVAIIIAPSHHEAFRGASVFNGDAYVTPLGNVMVDKELAKQIAGYDDRILYSMHGHRWSGVTPEHSLEVQLPFLQVVQPDIKIVPIVMGSQDFLTQDLLMRALVNALKNTKKKYLLIASTDLSHFHSADTASAMDKALVRTFMRYDYFALQNLLSMGVFEACGGGPVVTVMMTAEQLGAGRAQPTMYLHSGNTEAGKNRQDRVVGYFGGVLIKSEFKPDLTPELSYNDKVRLMEKVKKTVANVARGKDTLDFFGMVPRGLAQFTPVFVTLKERGELRACMGHTFAQNPLIVEVQEAAKLAATSDYRFGAISQDELDSLEYEITVMSRMRRILDFNEIEIGKDGLFIRLGSNRGLLLPQVASERNWDVETFLKNLCVKAGLPTDAYKKPDAQIFAFRALIIDEDDLKE
jgi:AmmeMemoRadiSam system protein B/AmmeMemoRadiSam system protein A